MPCLHKYVIYIFGLKTKEAVNQPRHGQAYNHKYYQIIVCHNKWIIIIVLDDGTEEEIYKQINQDILDDNVINMYLIIMEQKYSPIDNDDSSCNGYYIINFSSYTYTLQSDLSIYGQVINSG